MKINYGIYFNDSKSKVEDLLFALTEEEKIPGEMFGNLYERLSRCAENTSELKILHEELKGYE